MKLLASQVKKSMPLVLGSLVLVTIGYFQLHNLATGVQGFVQEEETPAPIAAEEKYDYKACTEEQRKERSVSFIPTHIEIKKSDINLQVVSVPLVNGTWKVYSAVANYAQGTGQVGFDGGNVGIYAHDRTNAFANIKKLEVGDTIEVSDTGHKAIYRVKSAEVVNPKNVSVFYPSDEPTLTLITCDGVFSEQRYSVIAELTSIEETYCN